MQPFAYPVSLPTLSHIWQSFMETGQLSHTQHQHLDPAVLQSWRRCALRVGPSHLPRVKSLKEPALTTILRAHSDLITISTPFMEDIHQFIEGSESAILLTDGTACLVSMGGDRKAIDNVQSLGLGIGSYWSEGQIGTTALGMALLEAMPIQLVGAEHFFPAFHSLTTTSAPIHQVNGRIIGILAVVSPAVTATPHTLGLVMSAARAISGQLQTQLYLEEANRRLTEVNTVLEAMAEGVIAWNENGQINHINTQAGVLLGQNPRLVLGHLVTEALDLPASLREAMADGRELQDEEMNLGVDGRILSCLVTLRRVHAGSSQLGYLAMLRPIAQVRRLVHQQVGTSARFTLSDISDQSPAMRQVIRQARTAARGMAPVLIRGEDGTGKNYLAHAIHNESPRGNQPFVVMNCRAIPRELMMSEFLGHDKAQAMGGRPSKFELADGGTLFLDQLDSLSLEMQAALLQVLDTGHVLRLGGSHLVLVDVRVIATTSVALEKAVSAGTFLPYLYHRLSVFTLVLPPLRERLEEIPILAERFLSRITNRDGRPAWISDASIAILCRYPWPGNVRELESVLERALNQSTDGVIRPTDLPEVVQQGRVLTGWSPQAQPVLTVQDAEREAITRAGWATQGRVSEMAKQLNMGRTTLWRKMKQFGLLSTQFKRH